MRSKSNRRRRAPRRKARLYKSMKGGALKTWTYNFKLLPQFLSNTNPGSVDILPATLGTGANPIRQSSLPTPGVTNVTSTTPLGSNYLDVGLGASHCLADLTNVTNFAQMYDAYKINYVVVEIQYLNNVSSTQGQAIMPTVWTYWDQDDSVPPAVGSNLAGRQGARCFHPTASRTNFKMKYRPMIRNTIQTGLASLTGNTAVQKSTWLNCTDIDVPHYAFKAWITDYYTQTPSSGTNAFRINFTYNVSFRGPLLAC